MFCNLPPDDGNFDLKVSMPERVEPAKRGKTATFTRVTDLPLGRDTVRIVMRGARRWWAIESETFKTLKYWDICAVSSATSGTATTICAICSDCSPCWPCKSSGPAEPPRDVQKALRHRQNLYLRDGPRVLVRRFAFPDRETLYRDLAG
ncbi:MAG: hypothetical protein OXC72_02675 [Roseovarius sp.]|nr:hypothetical protein [Roseovarius sp.]